MARGFRLSRVMVCGHASTYRPLAVRNFGGIRDSPGVILDCQKILKSIEPLNDRCKGPLDKATNKNTIFPFVFLLGNHSSGKSSFVNYLLNRKVQTAGVAPTDDSFTIIAPGPKDNDRDGPSFIGDPDMGFSGLKGFGPTLIHHTQLKVRANTAVTDFMIVDTPGMIDSPLVKDPFGSSSRHKLREDLHEHHHLSSVASGKHSSAMDRGYNFEDVIKWYAERADVILLFFDPDKPGTTGETLSILTNALQGMDHKLHIILNKADQFKRIHDFARAYGSLCWNLSKVIPRKDLPRIYTMCLPRSYQAAASGDQSVEEHTLGQGLADLEATREDVVKEVLNTPKRREDNDITRLTEKVHLLEMHCRIVDDVLSRYHSDRWRFRLSILGSVAAAIGSTAGAAVLITSPEAIAVTGSLNTLLVIGVHWWQTKLLRNSLTDMLAVEGPRGLESVYRRLYARRIADGDEYTADMWRKVRDHFRVGWNREEDITSMGRISQSDFDQLNYIIEKDIPSLRRRTAPEFTSPSQIFNPETEESCK